MEFMDMVPLIRTLNAKRALKDLAETKLKLAMAEAPAGHVQAAQEMEQAAREEWWQAVQAVEAGWEKVLEPTGLTRHDLRMAAL